VSLGVVGDGTAAASRPVRTTFRVGIGGPVGTGKTALIETLVPRLVAQDRSVIVVTNDINTREDEQHVKATLSGVLDASRIVGVETGACPHQAVREDPSMNLAVLEELEATYPDAEYAFVESGGDNLQLTFSRDLVDLSVFVIDVAGGDKIPRKRGAGLIQADLLVVNKIDLAPYVGADLAVMERDARTVRGDRPSLFADCRHEIGIAAILDALEGARAAFITGGGTPARGLERALAHAHDHVHA
jgi:urease accessory protein